MPARNRKDKSVEAPEDVTHGAAANQASSATEQQQVEATLDAPGQGVVSEPEALLTSEDDEDQETMRRNLIK